MFSEIKQVLSEKKEMEPAYNVDFYKFTDILSEDNPSYSGILAGKCKGDIWVDDAKNPELALVYSNAVGGFAILGEPKNNVTSLLNGIVLNLTLLPEKQQKK